MAYFTSLIYISNIIKTFTIFVLILFSQQSFSLSKEIDINLGKPYLPSVQVIKNEGNTSWRIFNKSGANFVMVGALTEYDAGKLLDIAEDAEDAYIEIKDQGGCPSSVIRGGVIDSLRGYKSSIRFEVVCSNKKTFVQITMSDKYGINYVVSKSSWKDIKELGLAIIEECKK